MTWLKDIAKDVAGRMAEIGPYAGMGLSGALPGMAPQEPKPPALEAFMQASGQERQAFLQSLPPDKFREVTDQYMSEANHRYGAMSAILMPMFQLQEGESALAKMSAVQQSPELQGMDANLGVAAAHADLSQLLGIDPFS